MTASDFPVRVQGLSACATIIRDRLATMINYVLTALAGLVCGVVLMRIFHGDHKPGDAPTEPLQAAEHSDPVRDKGTDRFKTRNLLLGAAVLGAVAVAVMIFRPAETGAEDEMAIASNSPASAKPLADVDTMIASLEQRLATAPNDGDGFRMLGWSYLNTGHADKAVAPYRRAVALLPKRADVYAGLGEALTGAAKDVVTPEAKASFDRAIALDRSEPRARFFLALHKAQNGQEKSALEEWITLANTGQQDAQWQDDLRKRVSALATKLGMDVSERLKPAVASSSAQTVTGLPKLDPATVSAANALSPEQRQDMVNGMVEGLARKLKANPADVEGWIKLLRSRMVLGDGAQAATDLATARKALASVPTDLARVNAVADELGVPGN